MIKKGRVLAVLVALVWACGVTAEDQRFECTNSVEKRVIAVVYEVPDQNVPCRVDFEKSGAVETLWSAKATVGYCERKANEFLERQRVAGFSCDQVVSAP